MFILTLLWGILPTREGLHKILPKQYPITICALCDRAGRPAPETLLHAVMECPENLEIPAFLLIELKSYVPGLTNTQVITIDIGLETDKELSLVWLIGSLLHSIWTQRTSGQVTLAKTRADLEARCRTLREGKVPSIVNASIVSAAIIESMFSRIFPPINVLVPGQQ